MKNVVDMSLDQKIAELHQNINRVKSGMDSPGSVNYSFLMQCKLGNNSTEKIAYLTNLVNNSKTLISRLSQLDYDVRQQAISTLNNELNEALLIFPGYTKEQKYESSRGFRM